MLPSGSTAVAVTVTVSSPSVFEANANLSTAAAVIIPTKLLVSPSFFADSLMNFLGF